MKERKSKFNCAYDAYCYASNNDCRLSLESEKLVATEVYTSYLYSYYVLKSRFELGEKTISTSSWYSYRYANDVLHSRFKLGERAISEDWGDTHLYMERIFLFLPPIDFLELCSIEYLEYALTKNIIKNRNDVIKVLFKKKLLSNE